MKQEYPFKRGSQGAFKLYISKTKGLVESELAKLVWGRSELYLRPKIEYALLSDGKRLRPILVILCAQSVGGNQDHVMPLAIAFELLHTATLIHDDIIDGDALRRGVPALHKKWGINSAILVGDALISLAISLAADFGVEIMKTVANSGLELCDGEYMDISLQLSKTTEEKYFLKIRKKSASLFKGVAQCGALAAGGSRHEVSCLAKFGECFGMAYQLFDDLRDLFPHEEVIPKDFKIGRITLPLIHLYRVGTSSERKVLEGGLRALRKRPPANITVAERILRSLKERGSLEYCENKMAETVQRGISSLSTLKDNKYKGYLIQMIRSLTLSSQLVLLPTQE